ncbi:GTP pyrophosphokinase family protein [Flavobacterium sp. H4147]|uniref:GTP pyrophosphokinase n=1 Tax=Flavobacterium sp. H4147 TaxID=3034149 RepID=UPI0023EBAA4E|nr:RelA/SpoT domain-containing protein [Flavobacterium sp. H4147]
MSDITKLLEEYDSNYILNKAFESKMQHLLSDLIQSKNLNVHNISSRLKERYSLEKKISAKNKYTDINQITDMIGVRIITFFEDEVDIIADLIKDEFEIDPENSIDKRVVEYDKFGYSSLHYVVSLNENRYNLLEYKNFKNLKFEIQIRSILQHAWAEIEHDIGYKSKNSIPNVVKRNFSRVAALLETSDLEFSKLRNRLLQYENEIDQAIIENPANVELNIISLESFLESSPTIIDIDRKISEGTGIELREENLDTDNIEKLQYLKIENIQKLSKLVNEKKDLIASFAVKFLNDHYDKGGWFDRGISLFYLCYIILLEDEDDKKLELYLETFFKKSTVPTLKNQILTSYKELKS